MKPLNRPDANQPASPLEQLTATVREVLKTIDELTDAKFGLYSEAAVELLIGTALKESGGLRWRTQLNGGPARGLFQMERATYDDIWRNYLAHRPRLGDAIASAFTPAGGALTFDQITDDDGFAAIMARLKYYRVPAPLPAAGNREAQAQYWKKYYNTRLGKGTVAGYLESWTAHTV